MSFGGSAAARPGGDLDYDRLPERFNIVPEFVDRHLAEGRGGRPAILTLDRTVSYAELAASVSRAASLLTALRVEREQRVLLLLPDGPEFAYAFFGAMKAGLVPVPLPTLGTAEEIAYALDDSRAVALVVHASLYDRVRRLAATAPGLRHCLVVGDAPPGALGFERALAEASPEFEAAPTHRDDMAYWLYSSGTTGRPKAIVHLHHDMLFCVEPYVRHVLGMTADDCTFAVPRLFFSVPTSFAALLRALSPKGSVAELGSLRLAVSAGEPLPAPLYREWVTRTGIECLDGLGATEVGYIYISNRPGAVRAGSSGRLLPGYRARIADETGGAVGPGAVGELWVSGESLAAGYWNKHQKTKAVFVGEWYRTGDRYLVDGEGYYFYEGRVDDLLRVGGNWVSPLEVESCLLEHPAVAECAVVGAKDEAGLVKPRAFVVRRPTAPADGLEEALRAHVRARLTPYKAPRWVILVDELPKTATGKVQRYRLREG
ncbi:MAG: benzoate-CoA ligase family protein [Candidatus Rokuibacteriota bacterium]|nr:MAG: benzoate-CoA ligase family protein [Candidatus Rokubacteria bacterium]